MRNVFHRGRRKFDLPGSQERQAVSYTHLLVAGYNKWRDDFHRNVKKGEKAIKILAPAPFKGKKEVPKLDAQGKPVIGRDGKPVTEVQEVQVPAFKIVSVFDVSQTEGEPLPSLGVEELTGGVEQYQDFFKANLHKDSEEIIDTFRVLGNFAAHKIQYTTKRKDIDNVKLTD